MLTKFLVLFLFLIGILGLITLYFVKAGLQLMLIRTENKKKPGRILDIISFDFGNADERKLRGRALMRYPLMFPVEMDESDSEDIHTLKRQIKNVNIALYGVLMMMILLVVYAGKAYPEGLF